MAGKSVSFDTRSDLLDTQLESLAKWLSCNGEIWGVGPTAVFASAAALFLYHELEATVFVAGDQIHVSLLEKTLVSTMVLGMLALMIHLWVCSMRFFQYYLDTLIRDSPSMLLEMTTAGLLGGQSEMVPLGPLTRFLKQQQPQIHITVCWFLSLCYADYVRKHYCQRFNMPYLEQWQADLHERASQGVSKTMERVNSFVGAVHQRLRGYGPTTQQQVINETESGIPRAPDTPSKISWGCRRGSEPSLGAKDGKELCVRLVGQSSETTADAIEKLRSYILLLEWAKCGESVWSVIPTVLWAVGAAVIAHRVLTELFRRFLFRRVPLWELILQHLLFLWMVIYSLHFWVLLVRIIKVVVDFCYDYDDLLLFAKVTIAESTHTLQGAIPGGVVRILSSTMDVFNQISMTTKPLLFKDRTLYLELESRKVMQQWVIWMCGAMPLAIYIHTRPRPENPPLMIWITTSPWQRREMGPYGYYLNRPLSSLQSSTNISSRQQVLSARRAFSDSRIIKEPVKKKRHSKSV